MNKKSKHMHARARKEGKMETDKKYYGWSNYETWCVALWLDNDGVLESLQRKGTKFKNAKECADCFKSFVEKHEPDLGCSLYSDLLRAAISDCDFYEIAEKSLSE